MDSGDCAAETKVIIKAELFSHICELFQNISFINGQKRLTHL